MNDPLRDATNTLSGLLAQASSAQAARGQADLNQNVPKIEYDPVTQQSFYDAQPFVAKRLMTSPLAQQGRYATGQGRERLLRAGWATAHRQLAYAADPGEKVYATASGLVEFVGYQRQDGTLIAVNGAHRDARGNVLNARDALVSAVTAVGADGLLVRILHDLDFEGYRTEYYQLGKATVSVGQTVAEGAVIGTVGRAGGPQGFSPETPTLPLRLAFVSGSLVTLVRPSRLVPNIWPGHDSTANTIQNSGGGSMLLESPQSSAPPDAPQGFVHVFNYASALVSGLNRATTLQNQDQTTIKETQARHTAFMQQGMDARQQALHGAAAAFQRTTQRPTVTAPMVFDFVRGVWLIDGIEQGPV